MDSTEAEAGRPRRKFSPHSAIQGVAKRRATGAPTRRPPDVPEEEPAARDGLLAGIVRAAQSPGAMLYDVHPHQILDTVEGALGSGSPTLRGYR